MDFSLEIQSPQWQCATDNVCSPIIQNNKIGGLFSLPSGLSIFEIQLGAASSFLSQPERLNIYYYLKEMVETEFLTCSLVLWFL